MRALVALAVVVLLSGCASGGDHRAGAIDLGKDEYKEIKVELSKGDSLSWSWSTTEAVPVHFDFHQHQGGGVQHLNETTSSTGSGSYKADKAGSYYLFWQNDVNATTEMTYQMDTSGKVTAEYQ